MLTEAKNRGDVRTTDRTRTSYTFQVTNCGCDLCSAAIISKAATGTVGSRKFQLPLWIASCSVHRSPRPAVTLTLTWPRTLIMLHFATHTHDVPAFSSPAFFSPAFSASPFYSRSVGDRRVDTGRSSRHSVAKQSHLLRGVEVDNSISAVRLSCWSNLNGKDERPRAWRHLACIVLLYYNAVNTYYPFVTVISYCLCVCLRPWAVRTWLIESRCCLGHGLA